MTTKTKIIGIPGYISPDSSFFGAGINHLDFISRFGVARILMPWEEKVKVDLLYLPGGLDLSPDAYGAVPSFKTSNQDVMKEFFFRNRLKNYVDDTPIFGVCLGFQMLGVHFGSTLTQDLIYHPQSDGRWETAHSVTVGSPDVLLEEDEDEEEFEVNSHHHQCILASELSDKLSCLAYTECEEPYLETEYIVEAFRHKTLPIAGVQFHPEELLDSFSMDLIAELIHD